MPPNDPASNERGTSAATETGSADDLLRAAQQLTAFPIEIVNGLSRGGSGERASEERLGGSSGGIIDVHLRAILGRIPTTPENFVKALDRSIELYDDEGHTGWRLASRGGAGIADFGISGSLPAVQAILAQKARETLETVSPILKRLPMLRPLADEDEVDAVRSNLETEFNKLIQELGREEGIRRERVDVLFTNILGNPAKNKDNGVDEDSLLGEFARRAGYAREKTVRLLVDPARTRVEDESAGTKERKRVAKSTQVSAASGPVARPWPTTRRYELTRRHVAVLEEEQHLADFVIMRAALLSFRDSYGTWQSSEKLFFSDELFNLSRALLAIQDSTEAVEQALDSLSIGEARRRMLPIDKVNSSMKLQDLLDWASDFATEEAPQILERGGRLGFIRVANTLASLDDIVAGVEATDISDSAFTHPRAQRAWTSFKDAVSAAFAAIPKKYQDRVRPAPPTGASTPATGPASPTTV